eukprot:c12189_g3_i3.p1 GENE.c12189_g3_i3~~c12189_g3_i3.p1  ORF type:complete len:139 (-),score=44.89 c12189_g3_i3:35-451(-)
MKIWRRLQAKGVPVNGSDTCIQVPSPVLFNHVSTQAQAHALTHAHVHATTPPIKFSTQHNALHNNTHIIRITQTTTPTQSTNTTNEQQCDVTRPLKSASWAYFADKNRLGLRKRRATFPQLSRDGSPPPPQPQQQQKD